MKRPNDDDTYDLFVLECSGRELYANNGIVGINPELEVFQGYDGGFGPWDEGENPITKEERAEIADYMIDLWKQWKNKR